MQNISQNLTFLSDWPHVTAPCVTWIPLTFLRVGGHWRHTRTFLYMSASLVWKCWGFRYSSVRHFSTTEKKESVNVSQRWPCDTRRATICLNLHINSTLHVRVVACLAPTGSLVSVFILGSGDFSWPSQLMSQLKVFILHPISSHFGTRFLPCCVSSF